VSLLTTSASHPGTMDMNTLSRVPIVEAGLVISLPLVADIASYILLACQTTGKGRRELTLRLPKSTRSIEERSTTSRNDFFIA